MGFTLVRLALERAEEAGIPHDSFRVLIRMATIALDKENEKGDEPNLYFAGPLPLSRALGYGRHGRPPIDSVGALKAVQRAIEPLIVREGDNPRPGLIKVRFAHSRYPNSYDLSPLRTPYEGGHALSRKGRGSMPETVGHLLSTRKDTRRPAEKTPVVHLTGHALSTPREEPSRNQQEINVEEDATTLTSLSGRPSLNTVEWEEIA